MSVKIKKGGQLDHVINDLGENKLLDINIYHEEGNILLWLNGRSLSYITIDEAVQMRDQLNKAIKEKVNI